jgi:hypothetical protein
MKVLALYILFTLLVTAHLYAQDYYEKKDFLIGVKVIPGISRMTHIPTYMNEQHIINTKYVFSGGFQFTKGIINNNIYISLDALCLNRGRNAKKIIRDYLDRPIDSVSNSENMYFVSFPLNIVFAYRNVYVGGGVFFDYFVHSKAIIYNRVYYYNKHYNHQMLVGVQAKIGYRFKLKNYNVLMSEFYFDHSIDYNISNFGLAISYNFKLNK